MTDVAAPASGLAVSAQAPAKGPRALAQAVTDAGAALVASDLAAMQAAQAILANPASTADDCAAALSGLPDGMGGPARATRAQALLSEWQAEQARVLAIALAELNGMIAAMDGATS